MIVRPGSDALVPSPAQLTGVDVQVLAVAQRTWLAFRDAFPAPVDAIQGFTSGQTPGDALAAAVAATQTIIFSTAWQSDSTLDQATASRAVGLATIRELARSRFASLRVIGTDTLLRWEMADALGVSREAFAASFPTLAPGQADPPFDADQLRTRQAVLAEFDTAHGLEPIRSVDALVAYSMERRYDTGATGPLTARVAEVFDFFNEISAWSFVRDPNDPGNPIGVPDAVTRVAAQLWAFDAQVNSGLPHSIDAVTAHLATATSATVPREFREAALGVLEVYAAEPAYAGPTLEMLTRGKQTARVETPSPEVSAEVSVSQRLLGQLADRASARLAEASGASRGTYMPRHGQKGASGPKHK